MMIYPTSNELYKLTTFICGIVLLASCQSRDTLFQSIPSGESGITFNNKIVENDSINILNYEYVYNGGGVAIADFNNDGLQDLYFVGNIVRNQLYLNKGNLKFTDVTKESRTGGDSQWYTGVSIIDINSDGRPDIYVCASWDNDPSRRSNMLFINEGLDKNGIPVFKDEAAQYGLANSAYSTDVAFFDYDNDGDLDMYEMVSAKRKKPRSAYGYIQPAEDTLANTDRLYRNNWSKTLGHPVFTDVSAEAGITKEGYGLGLHVFDINRDGWKDVYVSDDYLSNDLLWINNGNGTFSDHARNYFKHTSFAGMGTDAGDLNNDGLLDLVSLDMAGSNNFERQTIYTPNNYQNYFNNSFAGFIPQFTRNTLQLNQGMVSESDSLSSDHPIFSEIALLAGVAQTNWSWGVVMADFNNDGYKDMAVTNGIPENKIDKDFVKLRNQIGNVASQSMLLDSIPAKKSSNFIFQNDHALKFSDVTAKWGLKTPSYSTGLAWADLDNDGDLDLVMNNTNDKVFLYKNMLNDQPGPKPHWLQIKFQGTQQNPLGLGAKIDLYYGAQHQTSEHTVYRGYLSSVENISHFGLGKNILIDSLVVSWPPINGIAKRQVWTDVQSNQVITAKASQAKEISTKINSGVRADSPVFKDVTNEKGIHFIPKEMNYNDFRVQRMLPHKLSQYGPGLAIGDVNGDSLQDIFTGGSLNGEGCFFIQQANGQFKVKNLLFGTKSKNNRQEDEGVLLFDADNDDDLDLYIVSGSVENRPNSKNFQDRLYKNNGEGQFTEVTGALPTFHVSGSAVKAADYDRDGDLDLFVGGRSMPGFYPAPVSSYILRNDSGANRIKFTDVTSSVAKSLLQIGLVTDALWSDYNNDGWPDLIISGEWMPVTVLKNQHGSFTNITAKTGLTNQRGWWNSLIAGDFDNDGDTDYIAGNLGANTIYKATSKKPVGIYADDFDQNGAYDAVPSIYLPDSTGTVQEYPAYQLNDFSWQLPQLGQQFHSNRAYATATIQDIFSKKQLKNALSYQAIQLRSSYIENTGNGTFKIKPLPMQAQFAPVFGMVADDFNEDGNLDVLLNGNDYGAEAQVGAYDALNGLLLEGDGNGEFSAKGIASSGVYIPGNGKALVKLRGANRSYLIAASQNRGPLKLFMRRDNTKLYPIGLMDAFALIHFDDGTERKEEFYYGSSFLSASGRFLLVTPGMESAAITNYEGQTRFINFKSQKD